MAVGSHDTSAGTSCSQKARSDSGGFLTGGYRAEEPQGRQGAPGASRQLEVELNVRFAKVVAGDVRDPLQPVAKRIAVHVEYTGRVGVVATCFEVAW